MVFSSAIFLFIFLPIILLGLVLLKKDLHNVFLLIASLIFYAWGEGILVLLMIASILLNYLFGLGINFFSNQKKFFLFIGVVVNLSALMYYKYIDFIINNINYAFDLNISPLKISLPIGISFFTFQSLSYLVDVYRGRVQYQKNPLDLGLYISLFPQLIAGPIVRYEDVNTQIGERKITTEKFNVGVKRFIVGLSKKLLIANPMALIADQAFGTPASELPTGMAWLGIIAYTLQIYFDFSGYSDMAIGLGKMIGFDFLENFNFPYIAKSIQEFWRRWHISLSTWFKDYLYIPLGGNRGSTIATYRNLIIVFFITGLWHGASWNFIIWGLFHGFFIIIEKIKWVSKIISRHIGLGHIYTLLVVVFGWVLFRAPDLNYAIEYIGVMLGFSTGSNYMVLLILDNYYITMMILGILFSVPIKNTVIIEKVNKWLPNLTSKVKLETGYYFSYFILLILCIIEISKNSYNPFIYFRF